MSEEQKRKVILAIERFSKKQEAPVVPQPKRHNKAPEEEVVKEILEWCRKAAWSVHRVESKAVYNHAAGRYLTGQAVSGFPDICGNLPNGIAVWLEVKASGRRSTLRPAQREFLLEKISSNSFAVVVDSAALLAEVYEAWVNSNAAKATLLKALPNQPGQKNTQIHFLDDET